jgi:hypothetical protein
MSLGNCLLVSACKGLLEVRPSEVNGINGCYSYSPRHGDLRDLPRLLLEFQSVFESLALTSPRISHPLSGGNHVVYAASHPLQHPCSFVAKK